MPFEPTTPSASTKQSLAVTSKIPSATAITAKINTSAYQNLSASVVCMAWIPGILFAFLFEPLVTPVYLGWLRFLSTKSGRQRKD
jgi:hypothetical protein